MSEFDHTDGIQVAGVVPPVDPSLPSKSTFIGRLEDGQALFVSLEEKFRGLSELLRGVQFRGAAARDDAVSLESFSETVKFDLPQDFSKKFTTIPSETGVGTLVEAGNAAAGQLLVSQIAETCTLILKQLSDCPIRSADGVLPTLNLRTKSDTGKRHRKNVEILRALKSKEEYKPLLDAVHTKVTFYQQEFVVGQANKAIYEIVMSAKEDNTLVKLGNIINEALFSLEQRMSALASCFKDLPRLDGEAIGRVSTVPLAYGGLLSMTDREGSLDAYFQNLFRVDPIEQSFIDLDEMFNGLLLSFDSKHDVRKVSGSRLRNYVEDLFATLREHIEGKNKVDLTVNDDKTLMLVIGAFKAMMEELFIYTLFAHNYMRFTQAVGNFVDLVLESYDEVFKDVEIQRLIGRTDDTLRQLIIEWRDIENEDD